MIGRRWLPLLLFLATIVTTTLAQGPAYSATLMTILVAHEAGHHFALRHHGLPASLPYFIPFPPPSLLFPGVFALGTFGAVISMETDGADRNQLIDVGAAGPIAGFLVAVPAMILGILLSHPVQVEGQGLVQFFGDSLLTKLLTVLVGPNLAPGFDLEAHPVMIGAWAGFLVTSINLLPMGQLDGGHVLYAFAPKSAATWMRRVFGTLVALGVAGILVQVAQSLNGQGVDTFGLSRLTAPLVPWLAASALIWAIFGRLTGLDHPPVRDLDRPLTPGRRRLAYACLLIFGLCFMPNPMYVLEFGEPAPAPAGPG